MPCESTGFTLKADNFFSGNPTIDLPPDIDRGSKLAFSNANASSSDSDARKSETDTCCTSNN
jgi:hypothetical protein